MAAASTNVFSRTTPSCAPPARLAGVNRVPDGGGDVASAHHALRLRPGRRCDLNGDGDLNDSVGEYTPNTTNTRRYGISTSAHLGAERPEHLPVRLCAGLGSASPDGRTSGRPSMRSMVRTIRSAACVTMSPTGVTDADGYALRQRDRKSYAILNQFSFDYEGRFFDDSLRVSAGVRLPFFERDLNQYCYVQATGGFTQISPVSASIARRKLRPPLRPTERSALPALDRHVGPGAEHHDGRRAVRPRTSRLRVSGNGQLQPPAAERRHHLAALGHQDTNQFFFAYATEVSRCRVPTTCTMAALTGFGTAGRTLLGPFAHAV